MSENVKYGIIAGLLLLAVIIVLVIVNNTKKTNIKKSIDDLNVRFNSVKTIPLAFKLSKAQAMAKRNDETATEVKEYYEKYEEAQRHIDSIADMLENIEDSFACRNYKSCKEALQIISENIDDSEKEVRDIDKFLEKFSKKENDQRESSARLKEDFRELKLYINKNKVALSIANEGIDKKIQHIEDLFSKSEEFMYVSDYISSKECLDQISEDIASIRICLDSIPTLITDSKGVLPTMVDEVNRQYALLRQRGAYTIHLDIEKKLENIKKGISENIKVLSDGEIGGVKENNETLRAELNEILENIKAEGEAYNGVKTVSDDIANKLNELKSLHNYVSVAYKKDSKRFGIEDLTAYLKEKEKSIDKYQADIIELNQDIVTNDSPSTLLLDRGNKILETIGDDAKSLMEYKTIFDKNTTVELRAKTQLMKLQVVLNEVEVKVLEYHLPTIADSYNDDLASGRVKIAKIKEQLAMVPIDIDELNTTLDDAIDFIYKFYNNVNNIVGMAIMVENAIVFGNKYRSTYPEVERDLSKAEFSYLNGEYTKALTMAISCMERLFPNSSDNDYLENI
mgnify:FL=1